MTSEESCPHGCGMTKAEYVEGKRLRLGFDEGGMLGGLGVSFGIIFFLIFFMMAMGYHNFMPDFLTFMIIYMSVITSSGIGLALLFGSSWTIRGNLQ